MRTRAVLRRRLSPATLLLRLSTLLLLLSPPLCRATVGAADADSDKEESFRPQTFPNPRLDITGCGRGVQSRICDPGGLLGADHANKVEEFIKTVQRDTESGCGGFQIAVAITPKIDANWPASTTPRDKAARAFAMELHGTWGVGNRECQNGILLFISRRDRRVFISTGSGAKIALPSNAISRVIEKMRSYLKRDDFGGATEVAVNAIAYELQRANEDGSWWGMLETIAGWLVPLSILYLFFKKPAMSEYDTARLRVQRLDRERALARSAAFEQLSCPICLEEFAAREQSDSETDAQSHRPATQPAESQWRPELLRCGHKYCNDCLDEWLARTNTCPICRQDAVRVGAAETRDESHSDSNLGSAGPSSGAGESKNSSADSMDEAPPASDPTTSNHPNRKPRRWDTTRTAQRTDNGTTVHHFDPYSDQEWIFRVQSLRRLHPTFVTETMESRWSDPSFQGILAEDTEFIQSSPSYASFEGTGSSGFSSFDGGDFGGGSSSGGEGGGW